MSASSVLYMCGILQSCGSGSCPSGSEFYLAIQYEFAETMQRKRRSQSSFKEHYKNTLVNLLKLCKLEQKV
jgi:hypothetical protein